MIAYARLNLEKSINYEWERGLPAEVRILVKAGQTVVPETVIAVGNKQAGFWQINFARALEAVCRRVNEELIGYLFDPDDDYSLVWPRYPVLKNCIEKINALDEAVWREDEIIGWIYQFYNAEEKVAVRKRGKPQTPHDVAVINQFFTPRWIVKFLVDNTLGRLWLEMHPDSERVRSKCDYLVPEP